MSSLMKRGRTSVPCIIFVAVITVVCLWRQWLPEALLHRDAAHAGKGFVRKLDSRFSWGSITPTKELIWQRCYEGLQCARLEVPLNYSEPEGRQAAIALVRKPALIPPHLPFYRGPVLFNPGGPGGSGVDTILTAGAQLSLILGPQFDIVGFDPRGIGRSTPRASFFENDVERVLTGGLSNAVNISGEGASIKWAASQLVGKFAAEHDDGYLTHINTPNTARDMLSIVQAHGRDKLQYWGFSYGTILGATYATMFPDNVGRLVIDGVVDAEDYYGASWKTNLEDTDKGFDQFFTGCAEAEPRQCALHSPIPGDIRGNLTRLLDQVKRQPIPVKTETSYGLITDTFIRAVMFRSLYSPWDLFPKLADGLAKLAAGDASVLWSLIPSKTFGCSCDPTEHEFDVLPDATTAILCNDGSKVTDSVLEADNYLRELSKSSEFADLWAGIHLSCIGWPKSTPSPSFEGPFIANTSHPLLIIGNTADPVTPLSSAKKMSKGFKGSVVLTQDSPGHCSIAAPSTCTQKYIRRYFISGRLPEPGTICNPLWSPFQPPEIPRSSDEARDQSESQSPLERLKLQSDRVDDDLDAELRDVVMQLALTYPLHLPLTVNHGHSSTPAGHFL